MTPGEHDHIAKASIMIKATLGRVWQALITPQMIQAYMSGIQVISEWKEGAPIVWRGEWEGQTYEDKGTILKIERESVLQYSHFSALNGQPDIPENHHTITIALTSQAPQTLVTLTQDNNQDEEARQQAEDYWQNMLDSLKDFVENTSVPQKGN